MKSLTLAIALAASGCFMDPMQNENVTDVFGHTGPTYRTGPVYIGPGLQFEDESVADIISDCDSERYECEFYDAAE